MDSWYWVWKVDGEGDAQEEAHDAEVDEVAAVAPGVFAEGRDQGPDGGEPRPMACFTVRTYSSRMSAATKKERPTQAKR